MKYCIVYLFKGKAKDYHEALRFRVARRFNVKKALEKNIPPHITLKYPFSTDNIEELEKLLDEFAKKTRKSTFRIKGFHSFTENPKRLVISLNVFPSFDMVKIHKDLVKDLKKLKWLKWEEFDGDNIVFHATIARKDFGRKKFEKIWKYVTRESPDFKLELDNISILELSKKGWRVKKVYELQ